MSFGEGGAETDRKQLFWAAVVWEHSCGGLRVRMGFGLGGVSLSLLCVLPGCH